MRLRFWAGHTVQASAQRHDVHVAIALSARSRDNSVAVETTVSR